jgi:hypothetical protein
LAWSSRGSVDGSQRAGRCRGSAMMRVTVRAIGANQLLTPRRRLSAGCGLFGGRTTVALRTGGPGPCRNLVDAHGRELDAVALEHVANQAFDGLALTVRVRSRHTSRHTPCPSASHTS